jgi:hypothetical protein
LAELLEAPASTAGRGTLRRLITGVALSEAEPRAEVSFAQLDQAEAGFAALPRWRQTLGRELRAMGYAKLSPRPRHYAQDPEAADQFKKAFRTRSRPSGLGSLPARP